MHVTFLKRVCETSDALPKTCPAKPTILYPIKLMTLLECICCSRHHLRAAVVWEDPFSRLPCFFTYSDILTRAKEIARTLSSMVSSDSPVAIFGWNCPESLTALLAVLLLSACGDRGVAFLPVSVQAVGRDQERLLTDCGVELVVIETSVLEVHITLMRPPSL